jgi:hypothetical protein
MKIYLDTCYYNRPFDNQNQLKIQLESSAKLYIQNEIRKGTYDLIWSFMLNFGSVKGYVDLKFFFITFFVFVMIRFFCCLFSFCCVFCSLFFWVFWYYFFHGSYVYMFFM